MAKLSKMNWTAVTELPQSLALAPKTQASFQIYCLEFDRGSLRNLSISNLKECIRKGISLSLTYKGSGRFYDYVLEVVARE